MQKLQSMEVNVLNYDNPLRRQVFSLPELIREQYVDLEPKTRVALATPEIFNIQRIILTGCGDSYAAALAVKDTFEKLTKIRTEVVTAIDLARQYDKKNLGYAPNNPLIIAVSNSGAVARIGEAIRRANKYGAFTLGITGKEESVLGKEAKRIIKLDIPRFESAPGTRTYMVSVMALLLLAIRIGEVRGRYTMDVAKEYRRDIPDQAEKLEELLPVIDKLALELAGQWKDMPAFDFVGAGLDYASAWFGHAKIFEAIGKFAMHINSEEWLHLNFFIRDVEKIATIVFCSMENPAYSRTREMIDYAGRLGRPLAVITDGEESDIGLPANYFKVPKTKFPHSMVLTQFVPVCLIAGYIQSMIGEKSGRGCEDKWSFSKGAACVRNSEIIIV